MTLFSDIWMPESARMAIGTQPDSAGRLSTVVAVFSKVFKHTFLFFFFLNTCHPCSFSLSNYNSLSLTQVETRLAIIFKVNSRNGHIIEVDDVVNAALRELEMIL